MSIAADFANSSGSAEPLYDVDLSFLPQTLTRQCSSLIESYHEVHGYSCLPDMLWKSRLGPFIQCHSEFRLLLRKATTTRSAKKSNEGFVQIATAILALEILASRFAGWHAIFKQAGEKAQQILRRNALGPQTPLMDFYLYPPKSISSAAIAALAPPADRGPFTAELYRASRPELSGERMALDPYS